MTDTIKPSDRLLAHRILRAAGVDQERLSESARASFDLLRKRQREDAEDKAAPLPDARETWMFHSGKQLHRLFGGRCISCRDWQNPTTGGTGICAAIPAKESDDQISSAMPIPEIETASVFGCTLYAELPVDDAATIRARTELAIALELLQPFPGEDAPVIVPDVAVDPGVPPDVVIPASAGPNG